MGYFADAEILLSKFQPSEEFTEQYQSWLVLSTYLAIQQNKLQSARDLCKKIRKIQDRSDNLHLNAFRLLFEGMIDINSRENVLNGIHKLDGLVQSLPKEGLMRIYGLSLETIAFANLLLGRFDVAATGYKKMNAFYLKNGEIHRLLYSKIYHAFAILSMGQIINSKKMIDEAVVEAKTYGFDYGVYLGTLLLCNLLIKVGQLELASFELTLLTHLGQKFGNNEINAYAFLQRGQINYQNGRYMAAEKDFQKGIDIISQEETKRLMPELMYYQTLTKIKLKKPFENLFNRFDSLISKFKNQPGVFAFSFIIRNAAGKPTNTDVSALIKLLNDPHIAIPLKLDLYYHLVDIELEKIQRSRQFETNVIFKIADILDFIIEFAEKENSIYHKVLYLILKAKFHAIEKNDELLQPTLDLAEGFIAEYRLHYLFPKIAEIRKTAEKVKGITNLHNRIFDQVGFKEDFLELYDFGPSHQSNPIAFIITQDDGLELLNVPLLSENVLSVFVSGLLYGIKLLLQFWKEYGQKYVQVEDYGILYHSVANREFWLLVNGKNVEGLYPKFLQAIDRILENICREEIMEKNTEKIIRKELLEKLFQLS
ncbi:MAG: hypothetical protein D6732_26575 [Methanobacteriota archaeon]|nr:MAG: hypothetical protein D6732_26575 [Euryarchaeota archaeon]